MGKELPRKSRRRHTAPGYRLGIAGVYKAPAGRTDEDSRTAVMAKIRRRGSDGSVKVVAPAGTSNPYMKTYDGT
jgi:hypothetical protein